MIPGPGSYGGLDLQGSMRVHHQQHHPLVLHQQNHSLPRQGSMVHHAIHEGFPLPIGNIQDGHETISLPDYSEAERGKNSASDEDEPSFTEDAVEGHNDVNRGKKGSPWPRVKWTDMMVKLLITAVSYIGEDVAADYGNGTRRKYAYLQKKGKWKSVSKVMAERGHYVSPQQCEDKFNDLNKRYKRLNEILGRGTSCEVVERPELLDMMDHLSDKVKEERSLRLAFKSRDDSESNNDVRRHPQDDHEEDDQDAETDDRDEIEENQALHGDRRGIYGVPGGYAKRRKQCQSHEDISFGNFINSLDCNKNFNAYQQKLPADKNQVLPEGTKGNMLQKHWMEHRSLQLEEQKMQIQAHMLELEKERFTWQRLCRKRDQELEMMRMENERMKLENEHMTLELKRKGDGC
ncbi:hypothetical protein F0562_002700 [Nyssa sinensis]|uniref:Myb/SANT-like DNA-binding domain-containing protein n=1 Tax=Nyssa sinensis TaxID=561372 RepID=A0A5J5BZ54_9ASTE|nr:hypothetical protein F0562_002700 [Nyssa sinensis]